MLDFAASFPNAAAIVAAHNWTGWRDDGTPACNWHGISCNGDDYPRVINVSSWGLTGTGWSMLTMLVSGGKEQAVSAGCLACLVGGIRHAGHGEPWCMVLLDAAAAVKE